MKKFFYLLLCLPFLACGEMLTAMSSLAESQGSVCDVYGINTSLWYDGEWHQNSVMNYDGDGNDIRDREDRWLSARQNSYLSTYQFNSWQETSPYSGATYKFQVYCDQWAPQSNYNYYY